MIVPQDEETGWYMEIHVNVSNAVPLTGKLVQVMGSFHILYTVLNLTIYLFSDFFDVFIL